MIDTLLAHLDRFDPAPHARAAGPRRAVRGRHAPPARQRGHAGGGGPPGRRARTSSAARLPVVLPLHPRGRATLTAAGLLDVPGITVVDPLGYLDFLSLVRGAAVVVTDSGGIQEETTILGIPCLTLRPNTERPITISHGTNRLVEPEALGPRWMRRCAASSPAPATGRRSGTAMRASASPAARRRTGWRARA